jgi:hypothetical protein
LKIRPLFIAAFGFFLCATGLCVPAFVAGRTGLGGLFLAAPADIHAPEPDVQRIERFCEEQFPLSYEIPGPGKAAVFGAESAVTIIGTNSHYPRILGLPMAEGSFFSDQAGKGGRRHAVLNGKAAFDLFGTSRAAGSRLKLQGEIWIVTGIINDGEDESPRVYVPSPAGGGRAPFLLAHGDAGAGHIRDSLKSLGIYDSGFNFFDFGAELRFLRERAAVALALLLCLLPAFLIPRAAEKWGAAFSRLRRELKRRYFSELFRSGGLPLKFFASILALPACAGAILFILSRVVSVCLFWRDLPSLGSLDRRVRFPGVAVLQACETASGILFRLFLVSLAIVLVFYLSRSRLFRKNSAKCKEKLMR